MNAAISTQLLLKTKKTKASADLKSSLFATGRPATGDIKGTAGSSMAISQYYHGVGHLCPEVLQSVGSDLALQARLVEGVRHFFVALRRDAPASKSGKQWMM